MLNAVFSQVITKMEASFVGPVIGQRAQFSATRECARFLRINNALLPFFVVQSLIRLLFLYFDHELSLKSFVSY